MRFLVYGDHLIAFDGGSCVILAGFGVGSGKPTAGVLIGRSLMDVLCTDMAQFLRYFAIGLNTPAAKSKKNHLNAFSVKEKGRRLRGPRGMGRGYDIS